jgi:hypothetical protein
MRVELVGGTGITSRVCYSRLFILRDNAKQRGLTLAAGEPMRCPRKAGGRLASGQCHSDHK